MKHRVWRTKCNYVHRIFILHISINIKWDILQRHSETWSLEFNSYKDAFTLLKLIRNLKNMNLPGLRPLYIVLIVKGLLWQLPETPNSFN